MASNRGTQALRKVLENLTQTEVAARSGLSQSHISRLAHGETPRIRSDALRLKEEFGIEPEWWDQEPLSELQQEGSAS